MIRMLVTGKNKDRLILVHPGKLPFKIIEDVVAVTGFYQKTAVKNIIYFHIVLHVYLRFCFFLL